MRPSNFPAFHCTSPLTFPSAPALSFKYHLNGVLCEINAAEVLLIAATFKLDNSLFFYVRHQIAKLSSEALIQ